MAKRKLVAGNWKMNGLAADLAEVAGDRRWARAQGVRCRLVPAGDLDRTGGADAARLRDRRPGCALARVAGAHTGACQRAMLVDAGATLTIVGHSERREDQGESDADVRAKAEAAVARRARRDPVRRRKP